MIDNQEKIEMAQDIALVRKTDATNMFDRRNVIEVLYMMGHDTTAEYLEDNKSEYMELLKLSGEY